MRARAAERARFFRPNTGTAWWLEDDLDAPGPYDDPEIRPLAERCLLGFGSVAGPPMLPVLYNNLKKIVQTDDYVVIYVEMVHDARIVRMNQEHAPPEIRSWLGDSVGHWEGDTLVVDTTNFNETPALGGGVAQPACGGAVHPDRAGRAAVSVHRRRPDRLDRALERRVRLAGHE